MNSKAWLFLMTLFVGPVSADGGCKEALPDALNVFHEENHDGILACIFKGVESERYAGVYLRFNNDKNVFFNSSLIELEDLLEGGNLPWIYADNEQEINMLWNHPTGNELISLERKGGKLVVVKAEQAIRLSRPDQNNELIVVDLEFSNVTSKNIDFSNLQSNIFDKKHLSLSFPPVSGVAVSSVKARLLYTPSLSDRSKRYLIEGDRVSLLEYKNGWFKIKYTTSHGEDVLGWIGLVEIL